MQAMDYARFSLLQLQKASKRVYHTQIEYGHSLDLPYSIVDDSLETHSSMILQGH